MADLMINTADITAALKKNLEGFTVSLEQTQVGRVTEVGDGIARVSGLPDAAVNEMLQFEDGTFGLALNLEEGSIGAVVLGNVDHIEEGQVVRATGGILSVPVGDGLLGRVVNSLGEPIDGKGPLANVQQRRMEIQAPGIMGRKPVHEPMQTGIKAIDSLIPIGRGQRELIIGDRKTGKTTIAIDTIINQRGLGVKCIYVAIGQKASTVANTVETLREYGALEYVECVADDVKTGKLTSFPQGVKLKRGEVVVFSWITYKSRAERDRINKKVMKDPRLADMMKDPKAMPFDAKRMVYGGFKTIVEM